jgi:Protein of unknown function (DUF 659)
MIAVINEKGPDKFLGVVTNNTANMKRAWAIIEESYPNISCYGCAVHGTQLLLSDLCNLSTASGIIHRSTAVIKETKASHKLAALFSAHSQSKTSSSVTLKLPVKTCWASSITCLRSLLANKTT